MNKNIYIALDFPSWLEANEFLTNHQLQGVPVKVGMELFYREGPKIVEALKENGHPVFLDLKLHDIPQTVNHAMRNISVLDVDMVTIHALGGAAMIHGAKEGLLQGNVNNQTKLVAITILTSHSEKTIQKELHLKDDLHTNAVHFANLAKENGADGVVCSVHEATSIKNKCGEGFITVTPGIRLKGSEANDQTRIATPGYAARNQADFLVVGRSITKAKNPLHAYKQVVKEWELKDEFTS